MMRFAPDPAKESRAPKGVRCLMKREHRFDLDQRIDDSVGPIRSLQAHVSELLETSRKKTDDTGQHQRRFDELRTMIDHLQALSDRTTVVTHQLRDGLDNVRSEADQTRRDI